VGFRCLSVRNAVVVDAHVYVRLSGAQGDGPQDELAKASIRSAPGARELDMMDQGRGDGS
jgi:hypothetical protein